MIISYEQLKSKNPCLDQFKVYLKNFPDNWKVTKTGCLKAARLRLDIDWFADNFLSATEYRYYNESTFPALEIYCKTITPSWKTYCKTKNIAWEAYEAETIAWESYRLVAMARKVYLNATTPSSKAFSKAISTAYQDYCKTKAILLWNLIKEVL